jgi:peroxiredoxin
VQVLVVNVKESQDLAKSWAIDRHQFTFPVLLDSDGRVAATYAPPDVLPDLPRHEVPIASNLIIDKQGKIQFYTLLDSRNFDAKLIGLTKRLEELMEEE